MSRTSVAVALSVALITPTAGAFSLSSVSSFLSDRGIHVTLPETSINLPPRAEAAIQKALSKAESTFDHLFGEGGILDGVDLPDIDLPNFDLPDVNIPDVDQIVSDALARVEERAAAARSRARSALEDALSRAESVLDGLDLPQIDLPEWNLPNGDLQEIVDNALGKAQSRVEDVIGRVEDKLDHIDGLLDDLFGNATPEVATVLASLPVANIPPAALQSIESSLASISYRALPLTAAVAVPEPTAVVAAIGCVVLGVAGRRRR
ncbi:hypothetical protein Pla108_23990 [Botrimarina colliarenosi]|uniref:PEP-CTERM protein-sorting domain-containing protein n=1 Tax=Botrimarina colliarenosi TaxID=2528001 RepID=A0A5C6AB50_9BACT|nr:hypothetical protein [Botrimarina colliarenosi]TWT96630.1 hypothetical protein Pla108_23990 [Botrimarina colliarenosi]